MDTSSSGCTGTISINSFFFLCSFFSIVQNSLDATVARTTDPSSDLNPYWLNFPIHIIEFLKSWRNGSRVPSSVLERICKVRNRENVVIEADFVQATLMFM